MIEAHPRRGEAFPDWPGERLRRAVEAAWRWYPYPRVLEALRRQVRALDDAVEAARDAEATGLLWFGQSLLADLVHLRERVRLELVRRTGAAPLGEESKHGNGAGSWYAWLAEEIRRAEPRARRKTARVRPRSFL